MWKYTKVCVNPCRQKYAFPHVEIHMRSCISACGNTPKIVDFPTCGNTHFLVYFHMRKFERESEIPHVNLQADSWISTGKNVREYTIFGDFHMRKCEHAERYITACGNTLNQVKKKVYLRLAINRRYIELPHAEIHYLMWIPSWGKVYYLMRIYTRKCEFPKTRKFTKIQFSAYEDIHL